MSMSIHFKPPTRVAGLRRLVEDYRRYQAIAPIQFGGIPVERAPTDLSLIRIKSTYADLRLRIMGVTVSGTDPHKNYGEWLTTYTHNIRGDISAFAYVAVALTGVFDMAVDSDFATAFNQGDQLGLVDDSHTIEGTARTIPSVAPLLTSDDAGVPAEYGNVWAASVITDGEAINGADLRALMQTIGCKYIGQSDQDVGATPGDVGVDVVVMLSHPVMYVPSA
jgi:hypothetical protein